MFSAEQFSDDGVMLAAVGGYGDGNIPAGLQPFYESYLQRQKERQGRLVQMAAERGAYDKVCTYAAHKPINLNGQNQEYRQAPQDEYSQEAARHSGRWAAGYTGTSIQAEGNTKQEAINSLKQKTEAQIDNHVPGTPWVDPDTGRVEIVPCTRWSIPGPHNWTDAELASREPDLSQMNPAEEAAARQRRASDTSQMNPTKEDTYSVTIEHIGQDGVMGQEGSCPGDCHAQGLGLGSLGHCPAPAMRHRH
jgi:hypothetical protein